jgi:hypothetical protein
MVAPVLGVAGWLFVLFVSRTRRGREEAQSFRLARAWAYVRIEKLGACLLEVERADSRAAERYGTARTLFEQARTAEAMAEVRRVADEGLELSVEGRS